MDGVRAERMEGPGEEGEGEAVAGTEMGGGGGASSAGRTRARLVGRCLMTQFWSLVAIWWNIVSGGLNVLQLVKMRRRSYCVKQGERRQLDRWWRARQGGTTLSSPRTSQSRCTPPA